MIRYLIFLLSVGIAIPLFSSVSVHANTFEDQLFQQVNEERLSNGSNPLNRVAALDRAAHEKARALVESRSFQHTLSDGTSPWLFIEKEGYEFLTAGENLARNHESADEVLTGWMESKSHRINMLRRDYSDAGIASIPIQNGKLTVMYFAKPFTTSMQIAGVNTILQIDTALLFPLLVSGAGIAAYSMHDRRKLEKLMRVSTVH